MDRCLFLCITSVIPIPKLGITNRVTNIAFPGSGEGVWTQEPERGLAMAVFYFAIMTLLELFYFGKKRSKK